MAERDNPISVRSKRLITESLLKLMEDVPFSKISIKDIVDMAGLTRQTFYHNFESKEDVLVHKLDSLFDGFFQYIVDNKVFDCESIIWFYFRYWQTNDDFINLLIKNNLIYILEARYPDYFKVIRAIYLRDKNLTNVEAEYIYAFVGGAIINLLVTWIKGGQVLTPKELAKFVMQILEGVFYDVHITTEEKEMRLKTASMIHDSKA